MESFEPTTDVQLPTPGPDLNIPLEDLYHLCDRDAWLYSDELLIAAARATWYAGVYGHFDIGIERIFKKNPFTSEMEPNFMNYTFTCRYDPEHCRMRKRKRSASRQGTKNLIDAVRACDKRRNVPDSLTLSTPAYAFSSRFSTVYYIIVVQTLINSDNITVPTAGI